MSEQPQYDQDLSVELVELYINETSGDSPQIPLLFRVAKDTPIVRVTLIGTNSVRNFVIENPNRLSAVGISQMFIADAESAINSDTLGAAFEIDNDVLVAADIENVDAMAFMISSEQQLILFKDTHVI